MNGETFEILLKCVSQPFLLAAPFLTKSTFWWHGYNILINSKKFEKFAEPQDFFQGAAVEDPYIVWHNNHFVNNTKYSIN